jgi:hemerythrin-like metal-binding protein
MNKPEHWDISYELGIIAIDEQHQELIAIAEDLAKKATCKETNFEEVKMRFDALLGYTKYHLGMEEYVMQQSNFDAYDAHKAEHDKFVNDIQSLRLQLQQHNVSVAKTAAQLLQVWLIKHIQVIDKKFVDFLLQKYPHVQANDLLQHAYDDLVLNS